MLFLSVKSLTKLLYLPSFFVFVSIFQFLRERVSIIFSPLSQGP